MFHSWPAASSHRAAPLVMIAVLGSETALSAANGAKTAIMAWRSWLRPAAALGWPSARTNSRHFATEAATATISARWPGQARDHHRDQANWVSPGLASAWTKLPSWSTNEADPAGPHHPGLNARKITVSVKYRSPSERRLTKTVIFGLAGT